MGQPVFGSSPAVPDPRPWQAPLFLLAVAATVGIILDRNLQVPMRISLTVAVCALVAGFIASRRPATGLPMLFLFVTTVALGAGYYHWRQFEYPDDDIGYLATSDPRPINGRGVIDEEPSTAAQPFETPLLSFARGESTSTVVRMTQVKLGDDWRPVSGRCRLKVSGRLTDIHFGDEVEFVGRITALPGPENPGETDYAAYWLDRHVRATVVVAKTSDAVTRLAQGWPRSIRGWMGYLRAWGTRFLGEVLPPQQSGLAAALLLGDGNALASSEWEKYKRTGVIHFLVISGQHLAILAMFFWWSQRFMGVRRRRAAALVALMLVAYALLTGGRPPAVRAAIMIGVDCLGIILGRVPMGMNSLALAWLVVAGINPTDLFSPGCQLSFAAMAILNLGIGRRFLPNPDPLTHLVRESRPRWQRGLLVMIRRLGMFYAETIAIWIVLAPLVANHSNLVSPIGILIGPPIILLTSWALIAGFLLLLAGIICPPLVPILESLTSLVLAGCESLVRLAEQVPGAYWYVPAWPLWWVAGFYLGIGYVLFSMPEKLPWRKVGLAALSWLMIGLLSQSIKLGTTELRCTFLAVGHGGCAVFETPDGRTLLYDAGSLSGPDVARRQIAPYLWSRGIRRIDEVFLSHADLDHFNGLLDLMDRFSIGQVTCTPTFAQKDTQVTRLTLAGLERRHIPLRIVHSGDVLSAGNLEMEVLHPPEIGPDGNENTRSLVLLVRHCGHTLLLTGDLEGEGQTRVMKQRAPRLDVLMAPHHGSASANGPGLAAWAKPQVVISCEGPPRGLVRPNEPYTAGGARFFGTWPHGAITLTSHPGGLILETFGSQQKLVVRRGGE
jgi:competence protein ComEC